MAVLVVVQPGRAGAELVRPEEARVLCDVLKDPVCVAKQQALSKRGDEKVGVSIVIEIPDSGAHAVDFAREAGGAGDVGESSVLVVLVELECRRAATRSGP